MTAGKTGTILVLVLGGGGLLFAGEKARSRDGGSSSSSSSRSSSSAGERHHSSGTQSSGTRSSSSSEASRSSSSSSSDQSDAAQPLTDAQRRHPRAGTGHGHRYRGGYYGGYYGYGWPYSYYSPYRYGWYDNYWYSGYSPWYYSGYYGYSPYYRGRHYSYRMGQVRVQVEPEKTRVYVDGYYAGVADDFDGIFQRLNLPTGRHEIMLKLEGYRTHRIKIYVPLDQTVKIKLDMVKGLGEEVAEDWTAGRDLARDEEGYGDIREDDDADDVADVDEGVPARDRGTLRLQVTPPDASIYLNGEFRGTGRLETLSLPAGRYHLEIVRPGYRLLERDVEVEPGRTTPVVAALDHRS